MLTSIILAAVTWLETPTNGGTGWVYTPMRQIVTNGVSSSNIDTGKVCKVILVGTNIVEVSNLLGMTNWPDVNKMYWDEVDRRNTNSTSTASNQAVSVSNTHSNDAAAAKSWASQITDGIPAGSSAALTISLGGTRGSINLDPANNTTVNGIVDFVQKFILGVLGIALAWWVVTDWRATMSRLNEAESAKGFGVDVLGNNAPGLAAQINAGVITMGVTAGVLVLTTAAGAIVASYCTNFLSTVPSTGAAGVALYLFKYFVPVSGLIVLAGVALGWLIVTQVGEYVVRVLARHMTV